MELQLTDDQKLLRETTERFIADVCPLAEVRRLAEAGAQPQPAYRAAAGELGWFSMLVSEDRGGGNVSGEGLRDAAVVAELRGRSLQPGPFVGMNVLAQMLGEGAQSPEQEEVLAGVVSGNIGAAWVMGADSCSPGPGVTAMADADGYRLTGSVGMVQDAPVADWLLISARDRLGTSHFLLSSKTPGLAVTPVQSLDITQAFATVTLEDVPVQRSAVIRAGAEPVDTRASQLDTALVLIVAETVGAADALFSLTVDYAKQRTAFGRPIGSFQALKHQLADLSLSLEAAKAIAIEAARSVQARAADAATLASIAKAWTSEAAVDIAQGCLQVFGGIGYTWEHDLHLYLRRLTMNSALYGQPQWHRRRIWSLQPATDAAAIAERGRA